MSMHYIKFIALHAILRLKSAPAVKCGILQFIEINTFDQPRLSREGCISVWQTW